MPHHISSKTTTKTVRFVDSPNGAYTYSRDHIPSQTATYSCRRLVQHPSPSQHQHSYVYRQSQLLKATYSPKDNNSSPPSSSTFCSPECSQYSPLTMCTVPPSLSSLSPSPLSTQPPRTPDGLRHPITLPPAKENFPETSTMFELHESLRPPRLNIDLSQDISPYILTLLDKPNMSPQDLPENMILVSRYLPWRIHISPCSVSDMVIALYTALCTRVTNEEMKTVGGKNVMKAFSKWVESAGEEERRKGVRRVDFLLGYMRFVGIEPSTDEP
ncbi:hypothetical protein ARMGADRAFT_1090044 [Armillaria gallica]|uniref:DUF6699 domain-containing protein n=1 Tax=Armillaria gallica TaxID=47427 RepID=A0A2H3CU69_ARMGA|nr:hypothetical protein ARMGADRAFT_1090044 [Armillaria gallica]